MKGFWCLLLAALVTLSAGSCARSTPQKEPTQQEITEDLEAQAEMVRTLAPMGERPPGR